MARKTPVRTTIEPGRVIRVDDSELTDLDRQGLIHSSESGEYGKSQWQPEEKADPESEAGATETKKKGA